MLKHRAFIRDVYLELAEIKETYLLASHQTCSLVICLYLLCVFRRLLLHHYLEECQMSLYFLTSMGRTMR